jgi:hypothetical protein
VGIRTAVLSGTGVLEVTYSSEPVGPEDLAEQRRMVAEELSENRMRRVLIDASALPGFPSPFTALMHNKGVSEDDVLRSAKFAVVCAELGENERCLEDTGVNRGVNMRCFTSRAEALSWLRDSSFE